MQRTLEQTRIESVKQRLAEDEEAACLRTSAPLKEAQTPFAGLKSSAYQVIYADPPWSYRDKAHAGCRGAGYKYGTMNVGQIGLLPVHSLAAADCVVFMWATLPLLPDALDVMREWGFSYRTVAFTWVKTNKKADTEFLGMGNWTRSNAEVCLLGVRGKPRRINAGVRQVIRRPILRHSEKPPEIRDRIVQLLGDVCRCELFARVKTPGWDVWGNEVEPISTSIGLGHDAGTGDGCAGALVNKNHGACLAPAAAGNTAHQSVPARQGERTGVRNRFIRA